MQDMVQKVDGNYVNCDWLTGTILSTKCSHDRLSSGRTRPRAILYTGMYIGPRKSGSEHSETLRKSLGDTPVCDDARARRHKNGK